jgi:hypothetical protein
MSPKNNKKHEIKLQFGELLKEGQLPRPGGSYVIRSLDMYQEIYKVMRAFAEAELSENEGYVFNLDKMSDADQKRVVDGRVKDLAQNMYMMARADHRKLGADKKSRLMKRANAIFVIGPEAYV